MPEARLPCPVCLGVKMVKRSPAGTKAVVLDVCPRCGGMWFERGEVQAIRVGSGLPDPGSHFEVARARCPACHAIAGRDAERCPACDHGLELDCPECRSAMEVVTHGDLTLDLCKGCRGIWFDRHELAGLWSLALSTTVLSKSVTARASGSRADPGGMLLETLNSAELLVYTPDVGVAVVEGVRHAASGTAEILAVGPDAAGVVAEAAAAVFQVLLEAVAAILSGL